MGLIDRYRHHPCGKYRYYAHPVLSNETSATFRNNKESRLNK